MKRRLIKSKCAAIGYGENKVEQVTLEEEHPREEEDLEEDPSEKEDQLKKRFPSKKGTGEDDDVGDDEARQLKMPGRQL